MLSLCFPGNHYELSTQHLQPEPSLPAAAVYEVPTTGEGYEVENSPLYEQPNEDVRLSLSVAYYIVLYSEVCSIVTHTVFNQNYTTG